MKNFWTAYSKCKMYPSNKLVDVKFEDFEYIWEYIQQKTTTTYYLNHLLKVIPLGMLKYRLIQRISQLEAK